MEKKYKFSVGEIKKISMEEYSDNQFMIASMDFLGTNPNSHRINISEEVFRECAPTVLGKFVVADISYGDATTHTDREWIQGYVPREQNVRFVKTPEGYLRGVVDVVLSKAYAYECCEIFEQGYNNRSVSVEMTVDEEKIGDEVIAKSFDVFGVTILGMMTKPSSAGSKITVTRFSDIGMQESGEKYYSSIWKGLVTEETELSKFVKKRFANSYSVNEKELKDTPWGEVDKIKLKDVVMSASNRNELVKKVYLIVDEGWEDAPSEKLKYPVMELDGNTFYYNRNALASAMAYAKQHNEANVISKLEAIYKKFDLVKEGEENMSNKKQFEIEGREAWEDIIEEVQEHEGKDAYVDSVEKDHIIFTVEDVRYRVEADVEVGEDDDEVKAVIHWDTKKEDADQNMADEEEKAGEEDSKEECAEEECADGECSDEDKCAEEECTEPENDSDEEPEEDDKPNDGEDMADSASEVEELKKMLAEKEDIIMQKDAELEELRAYKAEKEDAEKEFVVNQTLSEVKDCLDAETFEALKEEGMSCKMADLDGWKNKAKSLAFDASEKQPKKFSKWGMAIPAKVNKESDSIWADII